MSKQTSRSQGDSHSSSNEKRPLDINLQNNLCIVKEAVGNSSDIIIRELYVGQEAVKVAILYTEGLADSKSVSNFILESIMLDSVPHFSHNNAIQILKDHALAVGAVKDATDIDTLLTAILSGDTAIMIDGFSQCLILGMKGWKDRGVTEPATQNVIRGPREAFSETLRTNTALIRRRIKDPNLRLETKPVGRVTKTDVAIMYIKGIANEKIVEEVQNRIDRIDIDGILESAYIEELIQDETFTPFPTISNTERPDVVAAALLEGRIAILVDGTPFVLVVPSLFAQYFQSAEDYYQRSDLGLIRILRYLCFFLALLAPSLYIAITTFHQEMLPTHLLISLAAQREGVPFPAMVEAFLMEVTFEILREAGIRMPRAIGQAVSIVGALVIGQAAVEAGIISAAMVIVVSMTAIASFVFPSYNMAISVRLLRFVFMLLSATYGLFGITVGLFLLVLHLASLRSFGVPYMSPFAPFIPSDQKDAMFRFPLWAMFSRPHLINQKNIIRQQQASEAKPRKS
ncbi:spore germination protein [Ectobacillus funiculus]|uniref:spore germination protein n=1 Tax=Ectobacillus funiculus TaxID=137993 RepID=UPI00397A2217